MTGDIETITNSMPMQMVDLYQIEGRNEVFRMDGTMLTPDEIKALQGRKSFLTVRTYLSHDEVREGR
jgi:hypothetical protein